MEKIVKDCFEILKKKKWFLIKEQNEILEKLLDKNCDTTKLNNEITKINNVKPTFINFGKLSTIVKDKKHYSYLNYLKTTTCIQ
jgi:hypothetical protein